MTRRVKFFLMFLIVAMTIALVGCKPIGYYLQQVDKAYGKVTDAGTGIPLESVEVVLSSYQYSELTNGLGDYELELAEGTWTLHFIKNGYVTADKVVTVNASNPRVKLDAQLTRVAPATSWLVGSWVMDAYYYYMPSTDLTAFYVDGTFKTLDNYDGSGAVLDSGTWSLNGNVLTIAGAHASTMTITKDSDDLWSFDSDVDRTMRFYRKGTQPGVSVFKYATTTDLSVGATVGVIPAPLTPPPSKMHVHQVVLYKFAPSAGTYNVQLQDYKNSSYTAAASISGYKADKATLLFDGLSSTDTPPSVSLGSGELIYLIVEGPYRNPGETFNILVQ